MSSCEVLGRQDQRRKKNIIVFHSFHKQKKAGVIRAMKEKRPCGQDYFHERAMTNSRWVRQRPNSIRIHTVFNTCPKHPNWGWGDYSKG